MKSIIVLGFLVVFALLSYMNPYTLLNPGELVEGHQQLKKKCLSCHDPFWGIPNEKCISCHKLIDIGKDSVRVPNSFNKEKKILFHQALSDQKCTSCHSDHKGLKPDVSVSSFRHELLAGTLLNDCIGCHDKPADKIHEQISAECIKCHNFAGWKSSVIFNHDMILGNVKNNCASCHQIPIDSIHIYFKASCGKCHNTGKWSPSSFNHSTYFQLDQNHNKKCSTCHPNNNFSRYTCYGCHEHSQNSIVEKHQEHGLISFTFCTSCHKSGNEHDILKNGDGKNEINKNERNNEKGASGSQKKHEDNQENGDDD